MSEMNETQPAPFVVKDCALITIATGKKAFTLRELADVLSDISVDSLYHHFWGDLLAPHFEQREYNNDFAGWARHELHDGILAERLAMIDTTIFTNLEDLRQEILAILETRLDESEYLHWIRATRQFEFLRSQIVVFDAQKRAGTPQELAGLLPVFSTGSIFYHFVDARRRMPVGADDFSAWVNQFGEPFHCLSEQLRAVEPYFGTLTEMRTQLTEVFKKHFAETTA